MESCKEKKIIEILKNQVKPALGCTEPGAVALAVSRAKKLLGEPVSRVVVSIDKNVLKNGLGVGIPGTKERGNAFAAALAVSCGNSEYGLEVLKDVNQEAIAQAERYLKEEIVKVEYDPEATCLKVTAQVWGEHHKAMVIIYRNHSNIAFEQYDDEVLLDTMNVEASVVASTSGPSLQQQIKEYTIREMILLAKTLPGEELAFIQDGIDMNMKIAEAGLSDGVGVGIGKYMMSRSNGTVEGCAKAYTAAASEARMAGWPLSVMSSAGSGNHGLTAIIPINVFGQRMGYDDDLIRRAVAFSHMVTIFVKSYLGALSPICGCGVAAGVGCAAGLTFLRGGTDHQIEASILNMIAGLTGMLCDGAKLGCAYKLAVAVDAAIDASNMALSRVHIPGDNGILSDSPEQSIINMAKVSVQGMGTTDSVIVDIMQEKC